MINHEEIAREVLRAFFNDPNGFKNMQKDLQSKDAVEAARMYLEKRKE